MACPTSPSWTAAELRATDADGLAALHQAARQGSVRRAESLLDQGAALEARDRYERTPLHWAAIAGEKRTARLLLERGANLTSRAWFDLTPLHWAAMHGHAGLVDALLERGAEVGATDFYGRTPLHLAADNSTIKTLLARGARLDAVDHQARTALHLVRNEGGAKALVDAGADPMAVASDGRRPLDMTIAVSDEAPTVLLFPSAATVRMRGERALFSLEVHNVSAVPLAKMELRAQTHAASVTATPPTFDPLHPGQVGTFQLALLRLPEVEPGEHTLRLALTVAGLPKAHTTLGLDTRRELTPEDRGMIKVGAVRAQASPEVWQYVAYGSAPLLLLGLWLLTRRRRPSGEQNKRI